MQDVGILYGHLVYFTAIWSILYIWYISCLLGYFVQFFPFWYIVPRKIWQLWCRNSFAHVTFDLSGEPAMTCVR
jgi:hypothetical protein